ncbi:DUF6708 domain-containing protein [Flavobacterium sp.]|uniref:DUF6708 domain-containing protein n=1 Tax=Flavobacterium sp. TaxID=239 RepID=UPI003D1292E6
MFTTVKKERKLKDQECYNRLHLDRAVENPHAYGRAIRMNSTYLETVDYMYTKRGVLSLGGAFSIGLFAFVIIFLLYSTISTYLDPTWDHHEESEMLWGTFSIIAISLLFIIGSIAFYRTIGEWFRYTHYPIRFNRKNRMIYVFRGDDTVLKVPWDEVYFIVLASVSRNTKYNIWGLVMKDSQTVKEKFNIGSDSFTESDSLRYWEFIRRYMEKGVPAVIKAPGLEYYLPIADKHETIHQGWMALISEYKSMPVFKTIITPFLALAFLGRFIYRWTSKVPLWPKETEDECRIKPSDPYIGDSGSNPEGYR